MYEECKTWGSYSLVIVGVDHTALGGFTSLKGVIWRVILKM